ncbi:MAG: hypothetical protein ABID64_00890 [Nitrospirota bacterium]
MSLESPEAVDSDMMVEEIQAIMLELGVHGYLDIQRNNDQKPILVSIGDISTVDENGITDNRGFTLSWDKVESVKKLG